MDVPIIDQISGVSVVGYVKKLWEKSLNKTNNIKMNFRYIPWYLESSSASMGLSMFSNLSGLFDATYLKKLWNEFLVTYVLKKEYRIYYYF